MNVQTPLIADGQPSKVVEPSECSLHHPSVPTQLLAALYASSGNTRNDASLFQGRPIRFRVVSLVGMQFVRSSARPASSFRPSRDGRNGINHHFQRSSIVNISSCTSHRKGNSTSADDNMALHHRFSLILRIGIGKSGTFAPFSRYCCSLCNST